MYSEGEVFRTSVGYVKTAEKRDSGAERSAEASQIDSEEEINGAKEEAAAAPVAAVVEETREEAGKIRAEAAMEAAAVASPEAEEAKLTSRKEDDAIDRFQVINTTKLMAHAGHG